MYTLLVISLGVPGVHLQACHAKACYLIKQLQDLFLPLILPVLHRFLAIWQITYK
jgi:hypothetical protein